MRNLATLVTAVLVAIGLAGTALAGPPRTIITGGGIVQNNNSGAGELLAVGGFVAQATGPAANGSTPARGQIQAKSTLASDPLNPLASLHGKVVCIANLGDGTAFGGTSADVWEVRFQVTHVGGPFNPLQVGNYGSLFVQDNGTPSTLDMADESFAKPGESGCGVDGPIGLEPVLAGNFTVHTP